MKWYDNLRIAWKFVLSFSLVLLILVAIGIFGLMNESRLNDNLKDINNTRLVAITELGAVSTDVQKINVSLGNVILNNNAGQLQLEKDNYQKNKTEIEAAVQQLSKIALSESENKELVLFQSLWKQYLLDADKIFDFTEKNQLDFALTIYQKQLVTRMEGIDRSFDEFIKLNSDNAQLTYSQSEASYKSAFKWSIVFMAISLIISGLLGFLITFSIRKPINILLGVSERMGRGDLSQKTAIYRKDELGKLVIAFETMRLNLVELIEKIKHSTVKLAEISVQIHQHAEETRKSSETVYVGLQEGAGKSKAQSEDVLKDAVILKEMTSGLQQVASSIDNVSQHSIDMEEASNAGAIVVKMAVEKISHVQHEVHRSFETMHYLGALSREIEEVTSTMKNIAEMTNLLSLNASIEASRAGVAGRGFAVVAQEIRKLAVNSNHAADQVRDVIAKIQIGTQEAIKSNQEWISEIDEGQAKVEDAGATFYAIQDGIKQINMSIQDVSASVEQLAAGSLIMDASTQRIEQFSTYSAMASQEFAEVSALQINSMEDVTQSVESLLDITEQMNVAIDRFVLLKRA